MQRVPVVPPELCDRTIDFLWDDEPALRACSLTCRSWLPSTRLHLFSSLDIHGPAVFARLVNLLCLSASAPSSLVHYIHHLALTGSSAEAWDLWADPVFLDLSLSQLLARLPALQSLALSKTRYRNLYSIDRSKSYSHVISSLLHAPFASTLRTLRLSHMGFANPADISCLLRRYPNLTCLELSSVYTHNDFPSSAVPACDERTIVLRDLKIQCDRAPNALAPVAQLLRPPFELRLHRLDWQGCIAVHDQPILHDVLKRAGPFLEHARLYLRLGREQVSKPWLVDLSPCTVLRSLELSGDRWLPFLLAQLRTPTLSQLVIYTHLFRGYEAQLDWTAWDWATLDAHLVRLRPTHVEFRCFQVPRAQADAWTTEKAVLLRACLPRARAAGVGLTVGAVDALDRPPYKEQTV